MEVTGYSLKARGEEKGPLLPMAKSEINTPQHHHQNSKHKEPLPQGKEKHFHYSSFQLSKKKIKLKKGTQFSYQHHFITVINKAHGGLLTIVKK